MRNHDPSAAATENSTRRARNRSQALPPHPARPFPTASMVDPQSSHRRSVWHSAPALAALVGLIVTIALRAMPDPAAFTMGETLCCLLLAGASAGLVLSMTADLPFGAGPGWRVTSLPLLGVVVVAVAQAAD